MLRLAGTTRDQVNHRPAKLPNYEYLRRGRALGWKLAPLALSKNSYPILRKYVDDADESMSDEMKDFAVGLLIKTGTKLNRSHGIVSVPLRWNPLPKATTQPVPLSKSGNVESTVTVCDAVPLLLNQDESNTIDLDLGASTGVTPSAVVSPLLLPLAQSKATYEQNGLNVKKSQVNCSENNGTGSDHNVDAGHADQYPTVDRRDVRENG